MNPRRLWLAVAAGLLVFAACTVVRRLLPPPDYGPVRVEGSFKPGGEYPGEPLAFSPAPRTWASWAGSDENIGTLRIGPFPAPARLRLAISGYPHHRGGNSLYLEMADLNLRWPLPVDEARERWRVEDIEVPFGWRGRRVTLVAVDGSRDVAGWLGVSEPLPLPEGRVLEHGFAVTLAAWICNGVLFGLCFVAAARWLMARAWLPEHWLPLAASAVVALAGYGAFWAYFAHPWVGRVYSAAVFLAALIAWARASTNREHESAWRSVAMLTVVIGVFYLAIVHLYSAPRDFYDLVANRFIGGLPGDNRVPHDFAVRLYHGESPKALSSDWLSSDRPPLQTGWQLLAWPITAALGFGETVASGTAGVWMQLVWVTAVFGLLRMLGLSSTQTIAWCAVVALSGFMLHNTVYTWPKHAAAAFGVGACGLWMFGAAGVPACRHGNGREGRLPLHLAGAALAALAWLSHGGVAFSFLALAPWVAWRVWHGEGRAWLWAAAVFALLVAPWFAYQRFYEPPANRLFKWHLAGQIEKDPRSTWQALRENYAATPWEEIRANKLTNLKLQTHADWRLLLDFSREHALKRREDGTYFTTRAFGWSLLGLPLLGLAISHRATREKLRERSKTHLALTLWTLLTIIVWCLLLFHPTAVTYHGSFAVMLAGFALLSAWADAAGRAWIVVVAVLQAVLLATTWIVRNEIIREPLDPFAAVAGFGAAAVLIRLIIGRVSPGKPRDSTAGQRACARPSLFERARANAPAHDSTAFRWLFVLICAVLLFLRKPHALLTPQLWAEDGSVFLNANDAFGISAFTMPYMGYLHTLQRLIAWSASVLLDPAWWPAFYNGVAFAVWVGVIVRTFSSRLDLPGKPWVALAFILGPQTGEILVNVTNLQWITAFVLVQQVLIARPQTNAERAGDLVLLTLAGLTGPFVIAFLPLFVWRWWREWKPTSPRTTDQGPETRDLKIRRRDASVVLLVIMACAAVQAWFILKTGPRFDYQSAPLHAFNMLTVLSRRLLFWPVLGDRLALAAPAALVAVVGGVVGVALMAWVLRPHPRRRLRAQVLAAVVLILGTAMYRMRPDTWDSDNLYFSDRYFHLPRVLLAWLLIWEFDSQPRTIALLARVLCATAALVHLRGYMLPAPQDYQWTKHVEPIRRGEPAKIPILPEGWTLEYPGRKR